MSGEKLSRQLSKCRYLSTDLSTRSIDHSRYRRSIKTHLLENTVDIDGRCRFTYGELRSIVDGRLKIEIILWSISSTTPVKFCNVDFLSLPPFVSRSSTHFSQLISQFVQKRPKSGLRAWHPEVLTSIHIVLDQFHTNRTEPTEKIQTGVEIDGGYPRISYGQIARV